MFLILDSVCTDYTLATILTIVKRGLRIVQIIAPIILIVAGTLQFFKLTVNPDDDKKGKKKFLNSIISAVIVFFIPFLIDLTMSVISKYGSVGIKNGNITSKFDLATCWVDAAKVQEEMNDANGSTSSTTDKDDNIEKLQ